MNIKSEKCFTGKPFRHPLTWLCCVILCVVLLTSYCLGWYISSVVNADNRIQASSFTMTAKVLTSDGSQVQLSPMTEGGMSATLVAGQSYTVNLGCDDKTTGHGCCIVILNDKTYQTVAFGKCGFENCEKCSGRQDLQFTVTVPAGGDLQIKLLPQWGQKPLAESTQEITPGSAIPYAG